MIVRLKHDEKPDESKIFVRHRPVNPQDSESDVYWLDLDELFRDPIIVSASANDVPEEIKSFLPKWRDMAKKIVNDKNNTFWPVKYASTDVWYQDVKYRIGTEIIRDIAVGETEQWLYEKISYEVSRDMYQLGAQYVEYNGMLD